MSPGAGVGEAMAEERGGLDAALAGEIRRRVFAEEGFMRLT